MIALVFSYEVRDTAHFEFISLGATIGIMQSALETETPISFGILTTYTDEQGITPLHVRSPGGRDGS